MHRGSPKKKRRVKIKKRTGNLRLSKGPGRKTYSENMEKDQTWNLRSIGGWTYTGPTKKEKKNSYKKASRQALWKNVGGDNGTRTGEEVWHSKRQSCAAIGEQVINGTAEKRSTATNTPMNRTYVDHRKSRYTGRLMVNVK